MTSYSLKVKNTSGDTQNVAVYQTYPGLPGGLPLVWFSKTIPDDVHDTFFWNIEWALSWGTTEDKLVVGVQWTSGEDPKDMDPHSVVGPNAMTITHNEEFKITNVTENSKLPKGDLLVKTDKTFTVKDAEKMSIGVYMNKKPAFVVHGRPNGKVQFETHPTYWLCTTEHKEGVAVSSMFVSNPKKVVFPHGETSLSYTLNEILEFEPVKA